MNHTRPAQKIAEYNVWVTMPVTLRSTMTWMAELSGWAPKAAADEFAT